MGTHTLDELWLWNFRNYAEKYLKFSERVVFVIGPNASGKTNLLEAIEMVSSRRLLGNESEKISVKFGEDFFRVRASYQISQASYTYEYNCSARSKNIKINNTTYKSLREIKDSMLKVVSFRAKSSLGIVSGTPSDRRHWLDHLLSLTEQYYLAVLKKYTRILNQRNAVLRQYAENRYTGSDVVADLEPWDSELAKYGDFLVEARTAAFVKLNAIYADLYGRIAAADAEHAALVYHPNTESMHADLQKARNIDLRRGSTSVGPQRDDFDFLLGGRDGRIYGSQGQQRSLVLALHQAELLLLKENLSYSPILLLDDVAAELDLQRQSALFRSLPDDTQVFVTTTHCEALYGLDSYQIVDLEGRS